MLGVDHGEGRLVTTVRGGDRFGVLAHSRSQIRTVAGGASFGELEIGVLMFRRALLTSWVISVSVIGIRSWPSAGLR